MRVAIILFFVQVDGKVLVRSAFSYRCLLLLALAVLGFGRPSRLSTPSQPCKDPNEIVMKCAPNPGCVTCNVDVCTKECRVNACSCKTGYKYNSKGRCIPAIKCPCQGPNQVRLACAKNPACVACGFNGFCNEICYENTCTCKEGFKFDTNGKCIPESQCPK